MFHHIAWFEFRYQLRSPVFWVGCLIFFLLTYGSITVDQIQIGSLGNVHKNSPYAIVQTLGIMCVFAVFIIVALVANVLIRDDETGFAPIIRSTRVGKRDYLVGRFVGATTAAFLVLVSVPLGILIGSWMPWLDPEKLGPNNPVYYAYALLAFGLPTLLIVAATFFALASLIPSFFIASSSRASRLACFSALRAPCAGALAGGSANAGRARLPVARKARVLKKRMMKLLRTGTRPV